MRAGAPPPWWPHAVRELCDRDPVLAPVIGRYQGTVLASRGDPFLTLARSIVGQQISVKAADSVWARLLAEVGRMSPRAVLAADAERLAACGLSRRKVEYIRDLAAHFASRRIRSAALVEMDDEQIIRTLTEVRGIGRWTAEMFLIFNLMRPDVLPVDDLGLVRAAGLHYLDGRVPTRAELTALGARWQPWRTAAVWYLWRSLDPVPVEY